MSRMALLLVKTMRPRSEHFHDNTWLTLDYLFGIRGYGLIIYGALPASLGALGAFKTPDQAVLDSKIGSAALPYIFCVALVPVILTFVQVRQRLANWYLLSDYLSVRATTITVAIILVSSLVCGANGLLVGTYRWLCIAAWQELPLGYKLKPIGECLLLSFAYLVGSSTLFLTVVKEDSNLPLLPGKQEVDDLKTLRGHLRDIEKNDVQSKRPAENGQDEDFASRMTGFTQIISNAATALENVEKGFTGLGRKKFYEKLSADLSGLKAAAGDVYHAQINWPCYWDPAVDPSTLNTQQRERRTHIERLRGLRLNG